jgi:hypothetical protein
LGREISIVLRDVPRIDDGGLNMLRRLVRCGVRLHGNGVYASHMVKTLQPVVDASDDSYLFPTGTAIPESGPRESSAGW